MNATGLGVGTISKSVMARLGFRACWAAAAKARAELHAVDRADLDGKDRQSEILCVVQLGLAGFGLD